MLTEGFEDYLKTLHKLGGAEQSVSLRELSSHLGVSAVSAHEMVRRLEEQGFVQYQPYRGVSLTEKGASAANNVARRHRLWECFLHDTLGIPWTRVHAEAERLEHATSAEVSERLAIFLNHPESCPHGYPIAGEEPAGALPLSQLRPGEQAVVCCVPEEDEEVLAYLEGAGIFPGTPLTVKEIAPMDGPITVEVAGAAHPLGQKLASLILVQRATQYAEERRSTDE